MEPSDQQTGPDSGSQEVNSVYLQQLRELDIPEEAAKQALLHTRNVSAEEAAMYYFNKLENEEEGDDDLMFKMVFVVNMDLAMGVGKVAAQVGHAAVGLYQALQEKNSWREMAWKWDHGGAKKVVLQGTNMAHLLELQALAMSLSLPTYLVQDAGRTQETGNGQLDLQPPKPCRPWLARCTHPVWSFLLKNCISTASVSLYPLPVSQTACIYTEFTKHCEHLPN
uniref:peptidyl-tRNA hydrolase n=1 Tax=Oncorhynchus kisutch TaxID=8019 RepID=A0A8C7CAR2_ONCKI